MMDNLMTITSYTEFKQAFDGEMHRQSEGFVRMGYLLRKAADSDLLQGSGYKTIAEFAFAEYKLAEDTVSRLISINKRYSQDGYSDHLQDKYTKYGYTLLAEMLNLSDEIIEALPGDITREGIREIKKEMREEEKISDLEVLMEGEDARQKVMDSMLAKVLHQYYRENTRIYPELYKEIHTSEDLEDAAITVLEPSGIGVKTVRIQGIGKIMMSIKGRDQNIELVNLRSSEKEVYTWKQCTEILKNMCTGSGYKEAFETLYGEPYPEPEKKESEKKESEKKTQINPLPQKTEPEKTTTETEPNREEENQEIAAGQEPSGKETKGKTQEEETDDSIREKKEIEDVRTRDGDGNGVAAVDTSEADQQKGETEEKKKELAPAQEENPEIIESPYKKHKTDVEVSIKQIRELLEDENYEMAHKAGKELVSALDTMRNIQKQQQIDGQMSLGDCE